MEREIKFRAKELKNCKWRYGNLHIVERGSQCHIVDFGNIYPIEEKDTTIQYGGVLNWWEVEPETVGQFTGLKDKNGVEIYEGDIFHLGERNITYTVVWHDTGLRGAQNGSSSYVGLEHWKEHIEIIGNIHDTTTLSYQTINNKNSMNTEKSNINMDKVYEFWYNECIHESAAQCMSLHRTREGAEKAMERHKKEVADKWGQEGVENFVDMAWGIEERIIEE